LKTKGLWKDQYSFLAWLENLPEEVHVRTMTLMTDQTPVSGADLSKSSSNTGVWQGYFDIQVLKHK
jgi:hypothetical protein